jgi:PAS domain S-box-containing protein
MKNTQKANPSVSNLITLIVGALFACAAVTVVIAAQANRISLQLSLLLIFLMGCLYALLLWLIRRLLFSPLRIISAKAKQIAGSAEHLGEEIPLPSGRELQELTAAFNSMSVTLRATMDQAQQQSAERERMNRSLQVSEDKLRKLVDNLPLAMSVESATGNQVSFLNKNFTELLGYTVQDIPDDAHWWVLAYPDGAYREEVKARWSERLKKAAAAQSEIEPMEATVTCKDGSRRTIEFRFSSLGDRNIVTLIDLTERKRAEETERLMSAIVQSSEDAIVAKDLDGVILSWNRGAERIYGYSAEEAVGKSASIVIPPEQPDELAEILTLVRRGERVEHYTTQRLRKDGQRIFISLTVSPLLNGGGEVVGASSIARDITRQAHAEEALTKSARELKEAQRIARIGSWDLDATTGTITWSEEYYRIYNVDPNVPAPIYSEHLKLYTAESAERLAAQVAKSLQTGQPYELELELANPDADRRWIFARGEAKYGADQQIVGLRGTAQNITKRKQAEAEILRLNADLEQRVAERTHDLETKRTELVEIQNALVNVVEDLNLKSAELEETFQKLEEETAQRLLAMEELREKERMLLQQSRLAALGEMISNIAHQWRQPLNELGLIVQELQLTYEKGNFDREYLKASVAKFMKLLTHTSRTIDDFRNFFKPDNEKASFKVQEVVEKTVSLVEESFRQLRITINVKAAGEPVITGHPNEFGQVILNILFNARDAFLARKGDKPRVIAIEMFSQEGRAVVTVSDNAGGIPEEILDKIFDPYFTTRGPEQGTGIGLYMSKIIIEKNIPGRLSARNSAEGAEFRIEV